MTAAKLSPRPPILTPSAYRTLQERRGNTANDVAQHQALDEASRSNVPFVGDALVSDPPGLLYAPMERRTRDETLQLWREAIRAEVLPDTEAVAWQSLRLDRRDGALYRPGGHGSPLTRHAMVQAFGLLTAGTSARGVASAAQWASPFARAGLLLDAVANCVRDTDDPSDQLVVRRYRRAEVRSPSGALVRAACPSVIRAVLSARHALRQYDDPVLARLVERHTPEQAPVYVRRAEGGSETRGWALVKEQAGLKLGVSFRSSETGQARLSFRAAASISCVDAVLTGARALGVAEGTETQVQVASARSASERNHTLPTVSTKDLQDRYGVATAPGGKLSPSERQSIADQRLDDSWRVALADAETLAVQWEKALRSFPKGFEPSSLPDIRALSNADTTADTASVLMDLLEENGLAPESTDRAALESLLADDKRLTQLPRYSAAHVAAAYAVLATSPASDFQRDDKGEVKKSKDGKPLTQPAIRSWDDAARLQTVAGRWVAAGWNVDEHRKLGAGEE